MCVCVCLHKRVCVGIWSFNILEISLLMELLLRKYTQLYKHIYAFVFLYLNI